MERLAFIRLLTVGGASALVIRKNVEAQSAQGQDHRHGHGKVWASEECILTRGRMHIRKSDEDDE